MEKQERAVAPGWWHSLVPLNYGWEGVQPGHTFGRQPGIITCCTLC